MNNVMLKIVNMSFIVPDNPSLHGVRLDGIGWTQLDNVRVFTVSGTVQPTHATVGLWLPASQNFSINSANNVTVAGFDTGIRTGEHLRAPMIQVINALTGVEFTDGIYPSWANIQIINCVEGIRFSGYHPVDLLVEAEHAPSGWQVAAHDLTDASNFGTGSVRFMIGQGGAGAATNAPAILGGTGLTITDLYAGNINLNTTYGAAGAGSTITGKGTVKTGGTTGQVLSKASNTNYDLVWNTISGGGNVSNTGTPTSGQLALWTAATIIQGLTALPAANFPALTGDVTTSAGALATTLAAGNAGNLNSGTLLAARMPALTGDITTTVGTVATTLANIPDLTPAVGSILFTNIAAPTAPASTKDKLWFDTTDQRMHDKNNAGTIGTTAVAKASVASNWLNSMSAAGVFTATQPAFTDITGTVALTQGGMAGSITASNGGIFYSDASRGQLLSGTATANKVLMSGASVAPTWSTPTFPNASATSGKTIRSDGTNWIASTATLSDAPGTAGKAMVSDGTNWIASTPTFPNASATTGKKIQSDGTNWIASAATWPTSVTLGAVVIADGTNYISTISPVLKGLLTLAPCTTSIASVNIPSGTIETTPNAGDIEFDGVQYYATIDTTSKRGAVPVEQYFHLAANGTNITTIANFFGTTSNISLVASAYYDIEILMVFTKTTTEILTITLTNSAAPTSQNIHWRQSPITGMVAPPGTATELVGFVQNDTTAAKAIAAGSLTTAVNHYIKLNIQLKNGTGTSLKIQATNPAGSITPLLGSYWKCRRISPNNIGTFAA
jgi:hypothetical protein